MDDSRIRSLQKQAAQLTDELKDLSRMPLPAAGTKDADFTEMQLSYRIGRYEAVRDRAKELCDELSQQEQASESVRISRIMLEQMALTADRQIGDLTRLRESFGEMARAVDGSRKAEGLMLNERLKQALKESR